MDDSDAPDPATIAIPSPPTEGEQTGTIRMDAPPPPPDAGPSETVHTATFLRFDAVRRLVKIVREEPLRPSRAPRTSIPTQLGPYRLMEELGRGAMGVVYRARHERLGTECAVKVLLGRGHESEASVQRFQREAAAVAKLGKHAHIVTVFDMGQEGELPYYAMELVSGKTLRQRIREAPPITPAEAAALVEKVARALHFAHQAGIIHRDIKPGNIQIREDGEPQVMDFGLARDVGSDDHLSLSGQILGTPTYMSPEQAEGHVGRTDARTDVYGLGAVLYELLAGIPPYQGDSPFAIIAAILEGNLVSPRRLRPDLPRDIETICLKCLEPDQGRRYPTALALAEDLERFRSGQPVSARPIPFAEVLLRRARRHWKVVVPVAVLILCGGGLGLQVLGTAARRGGAIEENLARGRELRREGRPRDARDAFQRVQALDASNAEAIDGLRWADAEVRRLDAEADEARLMLEKTHAVSLVFSRWWRLGERLARMDRVFYQSDMPLDERRAASEADWAEFQAFLDATPTDATSQATARALAGWARRLSGHADGTSWMREAGTLDPDVPYGSLLQALSLLSDYLEAVPLPGAIKRVEGLVLSPMPPESKEAQAVHAEIVGHLEKAARARVWGKEGAESSNVVVRAIESLYADKYPEADGQLSEAMLLPELRAFEAALRLARARARYMQREFERAREDIDAVLLLRPRYAQAHFERGLALSATAISADCLGTPLGTLRTDAVAEYTRAIEGGLATASVYCHRGMARAELGDDLGDTREAADAFQGALDDFAESARLDKSPADVFNNRSSAGSRLALVQVRLGVDPKPALRDAEADLDRALALAPDDLPIWHSRASFHSFKAMIEDRLGEDPRPSYRRAIEFGDVILRRQHLSIAAWLNRSTARLELGLAKAQRGEEPWDDLHGAVEDCTEALSRQVVFPAILQRGRSCAVLGEHLASAGRDPTQVLRQAVADLTEALRRAPGNPAALRQRAVSNSILGYWLETHDGDALETYAAAYGDLGELIRLYPEESALLVGRARIAAGLARIRGAGGEGERWLAKAREDVERAIGMAPRDTDTRVAHGEVYEALGDVAQDQGANPNAFYRTAMSDFDAALASDPSLWRVHAMQGEIYDRLGAYARAEASFRAAFDLQPDAPGMAELLEQAKENVARMPSWARDLSSAVFTLAMGDYAGALEAIRQGVARGEADPAAEKGPYAPLLYVGRVDLACICSLLSIGKKAPDGPAGAVKPEDAARWRDEAFRQLELSLRTGSADPAQWEGDTDLLPLREDPRWRALIEEARKPR